MTLSRVKTTNNDNNPRRNISNRRARNSVLLQARNFLIARKKSINGFTLIEILIVVSLIAILAGALLLSNLNSTLQKGRDSKRKQDLNKLVRTLEDYYNDHGRYPAGNDPADGKIKDAAWGSSLENYVHELPNDPNSPIQEYYYQAGDPNQRFFVIYARLENTSDPDIARVGCESGCGPRDQQGNRAYNFLVASGDVTLLSGVPNGQDPGYIPTPILSPTPTGVIPTPNCPPELPVALCCLDNTCCPSSEGKYCGSQQCPGNNNKCLYSFEQYKYLCSFDPVSCQ